MTTLLPEGAFREKIPRQYYNKKIKKDPLWGVPGSVLLSLIGAILREFVDKECLPPLRVSRGFVAIEEEINAPLRVDRCRPVYCLLPSDNLEIDGHVSFLPFNNQYPCVINNAIKVTICQLLFQLPSSIPKSIRIRRHPVPSLRNPRPWPQARGWISALPGDRLWFPLQPPE